ncbi:MAG: aminopeptidase [Massilibacteroides sp.]|nr:aminopeptidase [Massilibacteroides sp.]
MRRQKILVGFFILLLATSEFIFAQVRQVPKRIIEIPSLTVVDTLTSDFYTEKYVVTLQQTLAHGEPKKGLFKQQVVICHRGFDRPTLLVCEGYDGNYALRSQYKEELSTLFDMNVIFVQHRFFGNSTPNPKDWTYLTAENAAYDLHHVLELLRSIYPNKWISTGVSKGGQNTMSYRSFFPDDVDFSVAYVAPLNRAIEDPRQEKFLQQVGTKAQRKQIMDFQLAILKRKPEILPLLQQYCNEKELTYRITMPEVLDYMVLEYSFAFWQWGTPFIDIPVSEAKAEVLFDHLVKVSNPDYFSNEQIYTSFDVQAAKELGYYGYDLKPFKKYATIKSTKGYLAKLMLPKGMQVKFDKTLYKRLLKFYKKNDPKIIFIYGQNDPWSATRMPTFKKKKNIQIYIQPNGSHRSRIKNMPQDIREMITRQIQQWLDK